MFSRVITNLELSGKEIRSMEMRNVKEWLKNSALTRPLYRMWRYALDYKIRRIKKNMREKGVDTIFFLENLLAQKFFYYMDMGTMLGIVREGRLLGHDLDIDVAVYAESEEEKECVKDRLLSAGCKLKYTYFADNLGVVEHSFEINNLKFDVNYYFRNGKTDICYLMYCDPQKNYDDELDVVKLSITAVEKVKRIPFAGREVTVPENPETYLAERYGENWRIPDTNYIYWKGPSCEATEYRGYKRKEI